MNFMDNILAGKVPVKCNAIDEEKYVTDFVAVWTLDEIDEYDIYYGFIPNNGEDHVDIEWSESDADIYFIDHFDSSVDGYYIISRDEYRMILQDIADSGVTGLDNNMAITFNHGTLYLVDSMYY